MAVVETKNAPNQIFQRLYFMILGSKGIFTTIYKKTLFACSPGAAIDNPQFFSFFAQGERVFQPGQCFIYMSKKKVWEPFSRYGFK